MSRSSQIKMLLIVLFSFTLTAGLTAQAGAGRNPETQEAREARLAELVEELQLDPEQETAFREINAAFVQKLAEIRRSGKAREDMRFEMMVARDDRTKALKKVLSKKQMKTLQRIQREQMDQRRRQREGGGNGL